ncbi:hypothetical protein MTBPR1_120095 [Candidatus Terasakiella magnetica]|uniref:Uncharacterized protein n=1 Tax=Candidatus Terasakiella magnetica TaxID=1867952 RepID=A0A1C3REU5_9PROT|nr:hypothetical protein MTBPR1_120095 [Candidatus Terasakiella magnetica]
MQEVPVLSKGFDAVFAYIFDQSLKGRDYFEDGPRYKPLKVHALLRVSCLTHPQSNLRQTSLFYEFTP